MTVYELYIENFIEPLYYHKSVFFFVNRVPYAYTDSSYRCICITDCRFGNFNSPVRHKDDVYDE